MTHRMLLNPLRLVLSIAFFSFIVSSTVSAGEAANDDWEVDLLIYAWVADIEATSASGGDIEITFNDIVDNFDFAGMAIIEARKGKWSLMTDPLYLKISGSSGWTENVPVGPLNIPVNVDASVKMEAWIASFAVGYNVIDTEAATLDVLLGARYFNLEVNLGLDLSGLNTSASASISESEHNWDAIVGVKGNIDLNDKWFVPYYFDIGAGDSDLTWNTLLGLGYRYQWGQVIGGYRYQFYDFDDNDIGKLMSDTDMKGPLLGAQFSF